MVDLHQEFQNSRFFHEVRIAQRSVDGLIGIAAGLTADNQVNQQEAEFLKGWSGQAVCSCLPAQWLTGLAKHAKRW